MSKISIFNDLTGEMQEFHPVEPGKVGMYVCGVTVYDSPHLGHARSAVSFDLIRKYLEFRGFEVTFVMNYTDIDDHMINRSNERGITIYELSQQYIDEYEQMQEALLISPPTIKPRATNEIAGMIEMIKKLEKKGIAYISGGSVYFDTSTFPDYKTLFRKKEVKKRVEVAHDTYSSSDFVDEKRNIEDFVLWKQEKPGEPSWESPWGKGRPGWHIECSLMATKYLGETIDIHGGGKDLKRPHHQNEIAQSESVSGKPFANYWMHNGFLNIDNTKMSKSLGNFIPLMDMLEKFSGRFLRYYFISSYYSRPMAFSMKKLDEIQKNLNKIQKFYHTLLEYEPTPDKKMIKTAIKAQQKTLKDNSEAFLAAMDQDFNSAKAMGYLFALINTFQKHINTQQPFADSVKSELVQFLQGIDSFLNFIIVEDAEIPPETSQYKDQLAGLVDRLLDYRKIAKSEKNYALADKIREILTVSGIRVTDQGSEYSWEFADN
ncbi:MAG: cysteine--tRNA ligase [Promethearchaeota archaeon]